MRWRCQFAFSSAFLPCSAVASPVTQMRPKCSPAPSIPPRQQRRWSWSTTIHFPLVTSLKARRPLCGVPSHSNLSRNLLPGNCKPLSRLLGWACLPLIPLDNGRIVWKYDRHEDESPDLSLVGHAASLLGHATHCGLDWCPTDWEDDAGQGDLSRHSLCQLGLG